MTRSLAFTSIDVDMWEYLRARFTEEDLDEMLRGLGGIPMGRSFLCYGQILDLLLDKIRSGKVLP